MNSKRLSVEYSEQDIKRQKTEKMNICEFITINPDITLEELIEKDVIGYFDYSMLYRDYTAFEKAVYMRRYDLAEYIFDRSYKMEYVINNVFATACIGDDMDMFKFLVETIGYVPNMEDRWLTFAIHMNANKISKYLIRNYNLLEEIDEYEESALYKSIYNMNIEIFNEIIKYKYKIRCNKEREYISEILLDYERNSDSYNTAGQVYYNILVDMYKKLIE